MTVVNNSAVLPYGPFLPYPPVFEQNETFREFLLTKRKHLSVTQSVINAERSSLRGGEFIGRFVRARKILLADLASSFLHEKKTRTKEKEKEKGKSRRHRSGSFSIVSEIPAKESLNHSKQFDVNVDRIYLQHFRFPAKTRSSLIPIFLTLVFDEICQVHRNVVIFRPY